MVGTQDAFAISQGLFEYVDCLFKVTRILVGGCEVAPGGEGVGVVGVQDAFALSQVSFVQVDGLFESSCVLVGEGEVVA